MAKQRVLIVEDELIAALALEAELTSLGHEVVAVVTTGAEAIRKAKALDPEVIFMDIYLEGEITGIEAVRQIHSMRKIPIVYTTASQNPEILEAVRSTEHVALLQKPYLPMEVLRVLHHRDT